MLNHAATTPLRDISPNGTGSREAIPKIAQRLSMFSRIKETWLRMAEAKTFSIPTWAATVFLGVLLTTGGVIYWRLSDKLQESHDSNVRMEQALTDLKESISDKIKPVERQGLLNDEHQRTMDKDFADFQGYLRAKNGERYDQQKGRQ